MRFLLNHHSGEPIYRQIVEQVKFAVASGSLKDGAQLPSIRILATELSVNPRTIIKAYEELQAAGLAVMRHGQGVYITANRPPDANRRKALTDMARRLIAEADRLGATHQEIRDTIDQVIKELGHDKHDK
jgi:GntR family transcriptional regulator